MVLKLANFIGFQVGWFVCILGAANGRPHLGVLAATVLVGLHLAWQRFRVAEVLLILIAGMFGYLADSTLVVAGIVSFPETAVLGRPSTLWMVALWMMFAATLHVSLGWLRGRYLTGAIIGALAGPLSYYAGARLGAIDLADPLGMALAVVAAEWILAMPFLLWVADLSWPIRSSDASPDVPMTPGAVQS